MGLCMLKTGVNGLHQVIQGTMKVIIVILILIHLNQLPRDLTLYSYTSANDCAELIIMNSNNYGNAKINKRHVLVSSIKKLI